MANPLGELTMKALMQRRFQNWRHAPHAGTALVLGLLLWARLMVATDTPKIAIADPDGGVPVAPTTR